MINQLTVGDLIKELLKLNLDMPVFTYIRSEMVAITDESLVTSTCYTEDDAEIDCLLVRI